MKHIYHLLFHNEVEVSVCDLYLTLVTVVHCILSALSLLIALSVSLMASVCFLRLYLWIEFWGLRTNREGNHQVHPLHVKTLFCQQSCCASTSFSPLLCVSSVFWSFLFCGFRVFWSVFLKWKLVEIVSSRLIRAGGVNNIPAVNPLLPHYQVVSIPQLSQVNNYSKGRFYTVKDSSAMCWMFYLRAIWAFTDETRRSAH